MLPTIDFSLLGLLAAVWAGLKIIWDITCKFFKWVSDKALTLLIGSKFWATAAFFAASVAIMSLLSYVVNAFLSFLVQTAVGSISFAPLRESLIFLGNFLPLAELGSVLTFLFLHGRFLWLQKTMVTGGQRCAPIYGT